MKCKTCKGTGVVAQLTYDGDWEPMPCDCTIDPKEYECVCGHVWRDDDGQPCRCGDDE